MKIPVILDTDIGSDIDDTWALAVLLKSPEVDLKLVVTATGDTTYRARIAAKLLEAAGRADVPVGLGLPLESDGTTNEKPQAAWVEGYDLHKYPGRVVEDGVQALIETIMASAELVTLVCIGPLPNIAEALRREPRIAGKARFVGMHGSVFKGYDGAPTPQPEYNVVKYPEACRQVFEAPWEMTITPVDTCGLVRLKAEKYAAVCRNADPLTQAVIDNYRLWRTALKQPLPETESSVLFDTVAAYLSFSEDLLKMRTLGLSVTSDGFTRPDEAAKPIRCALDWVDLTAFEDWLVHRLT